MSCLLYFQFWFICFNSSVGVICQIFAFLVCLTRLGFSCLSVWFSCLSVWFSCLSVWFAHCKLLFSYYKPAMSIYFINNVFTVDRLLTINYPCTHSLYFLFYSDGKKKTKLKSSSFNFFIRKVIRYFVLSRFLKSEKKT